MSIYHASLDIAVGFIGGCLFMLCILLAVKSIIRNDPPKQDPPSLEDQMEPIYLTEEERQRQTEELKKIAGKLTRNRTMWD